MEVPGRDARVSVTSYTADITALHAISNWDTALLLEDNKRTALPLLARPRFHFAGKSPTKKKKISPPSQLYKDEPNPTRSSSQLEHQSIVLRELKHHPAPRTTTKTPVALNPRPGRCRAEGVSRCSPRSRARALSPAFRPRLGEHLMWGEGEPRPLRIWGEDEGLWRPLRSVALLRRGSWGPPRGALQEHVGR